MSLPEAMPVQRPMTVDPAAMAAAVASLKASAHMLQQSLVAVNGLPGIMEQQLQEFKDEFATEVTIPLQKRMGDMEAKLRDSIYIDPTDRQIIKEAVAGKAREFGGDKLHFSRMYGRLHREFGVSGYEFIRKIDLDQALRYVRAYDGNRTTWAVK